MLFLILRKLFREGVFKCGGINVLAIYNSLNLLTDNVSGVRVGNRWREKEVLLKVQVLSTGIRPVMLITIRIDFANPRINIKAANNYILRRDPEANKVEP